MIDRARRLNHTVTTHRQTLMQQDTTMPSSPGASLPLPSLSVEDILLWHSIPRPLVAAMSGGTLEEGLCKAIAFERLPMTPGRIIALGGAPGSGKSLTLAKLAARYALKAQKSEGRLKKPLVLACDHNPGSYAKLASVLTGYDVELVKAYHGIVPTGLDRQDRMTLVDLPGVCIYSRSGMAEMQEIVERTGATLSLVIPAGMDPEETADIADAFYKKGARTLIASRLEQSGRIGGIVTAAACGLTLTYGSFSSSITAGFTHLTPQILAKRLLILPT